MASSATSVTQELADFVAGLTLDTLPCDVREQVRLVLVDFFRAGIVGTNTSWGAKLRPVMLGLGGTPTSSILYSDERLDPVRAAYINAIIAGSLEWDDTHVGAMHHPGVCIWPSVLALAEKIGANGATIVPAVVAGYEAMIRIALSMQPSHFRRGFQSTATCGAFGAAVASAKLLGLGVDGIRDAIGLAASYSGGPTQFFLTGSEVKRLHAGKASAGGTECALLAEAGLTGPPDIIEGEQGFARGMSDEFDPSIISHELGTRYRMMDLTIKPHAGSARFQAAVEATSHLIDDGITADDVVSIEIGVPHVVEGRLTGNQPQDMQQAQMSIPFSVALALSVVPGRPGPAILTLVDFEEGVNDKAILDLCKQANCVWDEKIEAGTSTEYVPACVRLRLKDGSTKEKAIMQPTGCSDNPMRLDEICERFQVVTAPLLTGGNVKQWLETALSVETLETMEPLMTLRTA